MGMSEQMEEEVQGKEAAGQKEEEGVGGIDGASWSAGACIRRGTKQASFCLFHDFKYFVTNILYCLGLISQIINVFEMYFMISSILSQIYYTIWD